MKKRFLMSFILIGAISSACSSVSSDAKTAAKLNKKSLEYAQKKDLEKAEKSYREMLEIFDRYKDTEQFDEFQSVYSKAMYGEREEK